MNHVMRVNPHMIDPFRQLSGLRMPSMSVQPSCLAHQIVYAESQDKYVVVFYISGGRLKNMLLPSGWTLTQLFVDHGDAFVRISRSTLINTAAITGVFHSSPSEVSCSIVGSGACFPIARRRVAEVRSAFKRMNPQ